MLLVHYVLSSRGPTMSEPEVMLLFHTKVFTFMGMFLSVRIFLLQNFAQVGGVPCIEMNSLEIAFLFGVNFNLTVSSEEYRNYRMRLAKHAQSSNCDCSSVAFYALPPPLSEGGLGGQ